LAAIQVQIQALLAKGAGGREKREEGGVKVAKPQIFNGTSAKIESFISACKLYIRMRMRGESVEGQVQWMLSYIQGGSADVWKKNIMEELELGEVEYELVEEFLMGLRKEFERGEEESVKAAELREVEQGEKIMEEFV